MDGAENSEWNVKNSSNNLYIRFIIVIFPRFNGLEKESFCLQVGRHISRQRNDSWKLGICSSES